MEFEIETTKNYFRQLKIDYWFFFSDENIPKVFLDDVNQDHPLIFQKLSPRKIRQYGCKNKINFGRNVKIDEIGQEVIFENKITTKEVQNEA